jgi:Uma2 family endonuclease
MNTTQGPKPMSTLPPLIEGQRLDQPTFHARYEAMPPGTRAELINGVVHMPSPVRLEHGRAHGPAYGWLDYYAENSTGVETLIDTSTILSFRSEPQPDVQLRILPEYGGRSRDSKGYIHDAPELVVEVSKATRYVDLGPKLEDYERAGVLEYIVRAVEPDEVFWFVLRNGRFDDLEPGADGIYRSEVFPGLWLDPVALLAGDRKRLRAVVDLGCATPEHAAFVARLAEARAKP